MSNYLSAITIIKPVPGSAKFKSREGNMSDMVEEIYGKDDAGNDILVNSKPHNHERFADTIQGKTPEYSLSRQSFGMIDPNDPKLERRLENGTVLNDFVKRCNLKYWKENDPNYGRKIETADITDIDDPFFKHPNMIMYLNEGHLMLETDDSKPLNQMLVLCILTNKEFSKGGESVRGLIGSDVRYIIVDKNIDKQVKRSRRDDDKRAREFYEKLTEEHKRKFAMVFDLVHTKDASIDDIDDGLYDYVTDNITKINPRENITRQKNFLNHIDLGGKYVTTKYLYKIAKAQGIIRLKEGNYYLLGSRLAETDKKSIIKLNNDESIDLRQKLEDALSVTK